MYVLHHSPDTAALIVRLVLEELGQPYQLAPVVKDASGAVSPEYLRLNPRGLIPVLETPVGPVFETAAILLWLAEVHEDMAPAPGSPERGAFLTWLFFVSNTLHAELICLFYARRYVPGSALAGHRDMSTERLKGHFGQLETLCQTKALRWFGGAEISVLDIYVATLMRWAQLYPDPQDTWFRPADFPALNALAQRLEARETTARIAAGEGLGTQPFTNPPK